MALPSFALSRFSAVIPSPNPQSRGELLSQLAVACLGAGVITSLAVAQGQNPLTALSITLFSAVAAVAVVVGADEAEANAVKVKRRANKPNSPPTEAKPWHPPKRVSNKRSASRAKGSRAVNAAIAIRAHHLCHARASVTPMPPHLLMRTSQQPPRRT